MLTIPLYIFLFLYFLFVAVFIIFMLVNLYHIVSTASLHFASFFMTFFIFAAIVLVLYFTYFILADARIDWTTPVTLFDTSWLGDIFTRQPF